MTPEELEACWKDPGNRRCGVYYCKADPRVIVPKHLKWMGWTINFARPSAIPVMLLTLAIVISTAAVCLLCSYLSSSKRWQR